MHQTLRVFARNKKRLRPLCFPSVTSVVKKQQPSKTIINPSKMEGFFVSVNPVKTINSLTTSNLTIYLNNRHPYWHR